MSISSNCKRHKDIETLLSCTSCGDRICPRCMVQRFVGMRCPDCAKNASLKIPSKLLLRAGLFSVITGAAIGFVYVFSHWILENFLFLDAILLFLGFVIIGEIVARVVNNQQSRIFKLIISFGCLIALIIILSFLPQSLFSPYVVLATLAGGYISIKRG